MARKSQPTSLVARELHAIEREIYTRSFYEFVKEAWQYIDTKPFLDNWHVEVICDHLQAVAEGEIKRLLINVPPGTAKSTIADVLLPAWIWTHSPEKRIISASHKHALAIRDSSKTRRLIESPWYQRFWPTALRKDQNAKLAFENTKGGAREASALTSMTGSRGNIVIIDDPHARDAAQSEVKRKAAVETFLEAIPSRVNDPENDAIIVIMQRLHMDDVAGAILERPELGYTHLCIPLLADGEDRPATPLGWKDTRQPGENMFPQHFTPDFVAKTYASLGPFGWSGQYQQNPVPVTDGFFKREWFDRYRPDDAPEHMHYYMTSDHAPSGRGDYNVFRIWGVDHNRHLWLVDSFREKCLMDVAVGVTLDSAGRQSLRATGALPLIRKWKPLVWFAEADNTWASIKSFVETAMLETDTFCHIETLPTKGSGDKVGKAQSFQSMAAMGLIHLPAGDVGDEALLEYLKFPVGRHDDQVDADGALPRVISGAHGSFVAPVSDTPVLEDAYGVTDWSSSDNCWS